MFLRENLGDRRGRVFRIIDHEYPAHWRETRRTIRRRTSKQDIIASKEAIHASRCAIATPFPNQGKRARGEGKMLTRLTNDSRIALRRASHALRAQHYRDD